MADNGTGATVRRLWLASELKSWREQSGQTAEQVAAALDWSHSKVSRIESAKVGVSATDTAALCKHYDIPAEHAAAMDRVAREARRKTWFQREYADVVIDWFAQYVGLEESASKLQTFESLVVPGLLQTDNYARAVTRATLVDATSTEVEQKTAFRLKRQSIMDKNDPPHMWAIMAEGVIRQHVGGSGVMTEQLNYLIETAARPHVTIQIMPFEAGAHAAMTGPFVIINFPEPFPRVVYTDYLTSSAYLQEPEDVSRYSLIFDHLMARALDPERSIDLLRTVVSTM